MTRDELTKAHGAELARIYAAPAFAALIAYLESRSPAKVAFSHSELTGFGTAIAARTRGHEEAVSILKHALDEGGDTMQIESTYEP